MNNFSLVVHQHSLQDEPEALEMDQDEMEAKGESAAPLTSEGKAAPTEG